MIRSFHYYLCRDTLLQAAFDVGLISLVMVLVDLTHSSHSADTISATHGLSLAGGILLINSTSGLYMPSRKGSVGHFLRRGVVAMLLGLVLVYAVFYLMSAGPRSGMSFQFSAAIAVMTVIAHRVYASHANGARRGAVRTLIFGSGTAAKMAGDALSSSSLRAEIVGYYPAPNESEHAVSADKLLSGHASLRACATTLGVREIVVALSERRGGSMPLPDLLECRTHGINVSDISSHFERISGKIRIDYLNAGWLIFSDGFRNRIFHAIVKQIFDVVCAALLLALATPIMLLTMVLIRLESEGPVLYRQQRVGRDGKPYQVLKFRSMRIDAEKDGVARWAAAHDDRTTRVGAVIRKYRIDELPQLINVLKGDMSLVGPRPERPVFVEELTRQIPYYAVRQSLKPGITGWAQVNYQYGATLEDTVEKLQYDLYYVKNHTLLLDLMILVQTVGVVLSGKGAR